MSKKKMLVVGVTGSIGMGKSTAAKMLEKMGLSRFSADEAVHELLGKNGAASQKIGKRFPAVMGPRGVDRRKLSVLVFQDSQNLVWIESVLHPLVFKACRAFVRQEKKNGAKGVVLEIPLLFETGYDAQCDIVLCMTAPRKIQKERVLKRKNMTPQKLRSILKQQKPDREKQEFADHVIRTDNGLASLRSQLKNIYNIYFGHALER